MRIVFLSHTGRTGYFRVGSHHLAREFAAMGHRVAHVSSPISLAHVVMLKDPEVRRRARMAIPLRLHRIDGAEFAVTWSVFPLTPDPLRRPVTLGSTRLLLRALRRAGFDRPDLMFVDQPLLDYLIGPIGAERVFYRTTDIHLDPLARTAEDRVMTRARGVLATSQVVADELAARHPGHPVQVVENGVEIGHFASAPVRTWPDRRGAVYVGALDHRFDWAAVSALARSRPTEVIDLYGPLPGSHPVLPATVRLQGPVEYARLPTLLGRYRVGLLPLNSERTNDGRSPMKLNEYLAAGLNVVTRWSQPVAARAVQEVYLYTDLDSAAVAFGRALLHEPTGAGAQAAAEMDWSVRAQRVLQACQVMAS